MAKYFKYRKEKKNTCWNILTNSSLTGILSFMLLALGGIFYLAYYHFIGFLPKLGSFSDFSYLLLVMSILGTLLFLFLLLMFLLPTLFFNLMAKYDNRKDVTLGGFIWFSAIPHMSIILSMCIAEFINPKSSAVLLIAFIFSLFFCPYFCVKRYKELDFSRKKELAIKMVPLVILTFFTFLIFYIFISSGQSNLATSLDVIIAYFWFSLFVVLVNTFYIDYKYFQEIKMKINLKILTTISVFFFFLMTSNTYAFVSSIVMNKFRLGNYLITSVGVKERSCNALRMENNLSSIKIMTHNKNSSYCKLEGEICVLSNIGESIYFKLDENQTIELPSEDFFGQVNNGNKRCLIRKK